MRLIMPEEIKKLDELTDPYMKNGGGIVDDAPAEVKEAYKKLKEWYDKQHELL